MPGPISQGAGRGDGSRVKRGPEGQPGGDSLPHALGGNTVRTGRTGWAAGRRSRMDGKGQCWPTAREGRWFLRDAVRRGRFRRATGSGHLPNQGGLQEATPTARKPMPASRKDGRSLLLQGQAQPRPSPRVRAAPPAFEGERTPCRRPRAPLETDVPESRWGTPLWISARSRGSPLLSPPPRQGLFAAPPQRKTEPLSAPSGVPAPAGEAGPPAARRDRPAPRPPRRKEATERGGAGADPDFTCCGSLAPVSSAKKPVERKQVG